MNYLIASSSLDPHVVRAGPYTRIPTSHSILVPPIPVVRSCDDSDRFSGATQANRSISSGGGWSGDSIALPGTLSRCRVYDDICPTSLATSWALPRCLAGSETGSSTVFAFNGPQFMAPYANTGGTLPNAWEHRTFW